MGKLQARREVTVIKMSKCNRCGREIRKDEFREVHPLTKEETCTECSLKEMIARYC